MRIHGLMAGLVLLSGSALAGDLGLPEVPIPVDNPQTPEKVALGDRLFHDTRFSTTGEVSCSTCHDAPTGWTDSPKVVSEGIGGKTGTRNSPTVLNAAFNKSQFWDGRSPSLEDQSQHPFINPVEMGLADHEPILAVVRDDAEYGEQFNKAFGVATEGITMDHVQKAIAAFERTVVSGNSPFDRWFFGGEADALNAQEQEGYRLFITKGRCVSCHVIEQTSATFTDHRFHNIGVGINRIQDDIAPLAHAFMKADATVEEVDVAVLTDPRSSELGRFAVTRDLDEMGNFKTPTLRNVSLTAPYMHDGSIETLPKVIEHYNNGGVTSEGDPVNDFLSGGIRPLDLSDEEQAALVAFLEALTSPVIPTSSTK